MNLREFKDTVQGGGEICVPIKEFGASALKTGKSGKVSFKDFLKAAFAKPRNVNPIAPNQADYVNWILYDRISFAAAATIPNLFKLFVAPIGSGTKTKVDTNLDQVSTLPAPQWMNVTQLCVFFNGNAAPVDLNAFLSTEYIEFWVGGTKVYVEGPVDQFPQGGGIFNQTSMSLVAAATAFVTQSTNGWPSQHNMYDLRLPQGLSLGRDTNGAAVVSDGLLGITILQSQTFNVQFKADGGGATLAAGGATPIPGVGLTVGTRLHGILSRGVY